MAYPYDDQLDPDVRVFLEAFRVHAPLATPNERPAALITDDMPVELKAWLHTYSLHNSMVSIGDLWFEASACLPLSHILELWDPEDVEEMQRFDVDQVNLDTAIVMGNTADGEVFYAAAWGPGDSKVTLVKVCSAGYDDDGFEGLGPLMASLRAFAANLADPDSLDERGRAALGL